MIDKIVPSKYGSVLWIVVSIYFSFSKYILLFQCLIVGYALIGMIDQYLSGYSLQYYARAAPELFKRKIASSE